MALELSQEEHDTLMGGPLAAAMAVMAVDMGIFSSAREAMALGRTLAGAAERYAGNPLISGLFDPEALKRGVHPQTLAITPQELRDGKLLDRALEVVDRGVALARTRAEEAAVQQYCALIVEGCEAVAAAAGSGLFGSGERVSSAERAALTRLRQHLGIEEKEAV